MVTDEELSAALGARAVVDRVVDPEMPMLTLDDLGVIRSVTETPTSSGTAVEVTITPTYSGCPAIDEMCADITRALTADGYRPVEVRTVFAPAWSTDWISDAGRRKLAEAGIAPPGATSRRPDGPIPLTLEAPSSTVRCPQCGSPATEEFSRFGPTACTALRRCTVCREPFEHMKEI
ncbi:1,2-phenylacetyl-CoA epoxidase subunit PaaD [Pseudonocardia spirodelae]|uniref:1,2-phenylacetyl-CoA epoxidase subunit PaaD n=1 Tax=Pseudonocardia spirodelae TaxID=3133431 RepID=A0ABU8TE33_9PSEU